MSIDTVPAAPQAHAAHVFGLTPRTGVGEAAYFDADNGNVFEAVWRDKANVWHEAPVGTVTGGIWQRLRISIQADASHPNPVITWYQQLYGSGSWATLFSITDTSVGIYVPPTALKIGAFLEPGDAPWAGQLYTRFGPVVISDVPLP